MTSTTSRRWMAGGTIPVLLAVAIVIAWFPTWSQPYAEDDWLFLEAVRSADGATLARYLWSEGVMDHHFRPLSDPFFFSLASALFGLAPVGYHLLLTLGQLVAASCLTFLVLRLGFSRAVAILTGLLYVTRDFAYPSLVWASGVSDIGSAAFGFGSLLLLVRSLEPGRRFARVGSVLCFVLAMLTKETAIVLLGLAALVTLAAGRFGPNESRVRAVAGVIWPFLLVGLPLAAFQFLTARFESDYGQSLYTLELGLHPFRIWPVYLLWCVAGVSEIISSRVPAHLYAGVGFLGLALAAALAWWRQRSGTKAVSAAGTGAGWLVWFFIAIAPALLAPNRILTNYVAIAAAGPCLALAAALVALWCRKGGARALATALGIALLALGPALVQMKSTGQLAGGGWVDAAKARELDRLLTTLTTTLLPEPARDARIVVFGGKAVDIVVLGDPRRQGFGPQPVLGSALRTRYGRYDLETLSLPSARVAMPEVFERVAQFIRQRPHGTYVVTTSDGVRDMTGPVREAVLAGVDPEGLRRLLVQ